MRSRDEEIAWAAGLFEGEGTITLSGDTLYVRLGNTDGEVVRQFADAVGVGSVYGPYPPYPGQSHRKKLLWVSLAREEDGLDVLAMMWQWLSARRRNRAREITGIRFPVFSEVARTLRAQQGESARAGRWADAE
jgi:hypothetical protein